jgi:hypothetical protein
MAEVCRNKNMFNGANDLCATFLSPLRSYIATSLLT